MRKTAWIGMVSLLALAGCAEQQDGLCHIETLGDLPVLNKFGSPIVGVTINGHDAAMIVDSGADLSMISEKPSKAFGLVDTGHVLTISGVTGEMLSPVMEADKMGLGSGTSGTVYLTQAKRSFGGMIAGRPIVGLFGADFLRHNRVWISYRHEVLYIQRMTPPERDHTFELHVRRKTVPGTGSAPAQSPPPPTAPVASP